jgi:hypothetical protein
MSLRPEYALGNSPYNAFLFAAVGEEREGQPLTVLSALARLGLDPWKEAARLAGLPREAAARAFAVSIAMLPEGNWKSSDSDAIAKRLVDELPTGSDARPPAPQAVPPRRDGAASGFTLPVMPRWLFWAALAVAGGLFFWQLLPNTSFEAPSSAMTTSN